MNTFFFVPSSYSVHDIHGACAFGYSCRARLPYPCQTATEEQDGARVEKANEAAAAMRDLVLTLTLTRQP